MAQRLTLIRGLPGSGKTTLARAIAEATNADHWEIDRYFYRKDQYGFNPSELDTAHRWCRHNVRSAMDHGKDVVVSNTFVKREHLKPYYEMAEARGVEVVEIVCKGRWQNIHNVPQRVVDRMKEEWEN